MPRRGYLLALFGEHLQQERNSAGHQRFRQLRDWLLHWEALYPAWDTRVGVRVAYELDIGGYDSFSNSGVTVLLFFPVIHQNFQGF